MNIKANNEKYKIVFLIPVFEAIDCVEDFIQNIHTVCPNSAIVFHVNSNSSIQYFENVQKLCNYYSFCYLFSERYPSDWANGYLAKVYTELQNWCYHNLNYDYVYFTASNSLVVNPNLESEIYAHDVYYWEPGIKKDGDFWEIISQDRVLLNYSDVVYVTLIEGQVFSKEKSKLIIDELIHVLDYTPLKYGTEEYWFPTAYKKLEKKHNWHNAGYTMERWAWLGDFIIHDYQFDAKKVDEYVIHLICNSNFDILSNMKIYSLKRIDRVYNSFMRKTIREHFGYHNKIF